MTSAEPEDLQSLGPVGILFTGGTAGSEKHDGVIDVTTHPTDAVSGSEQQLLDAWPFPWAPDFKIRRPVTKLSENMNKDDWLKIAESVRELVEQEHVAWVVIVHGTDTMTFTGSALRMLLRGMTPPVVLTGSNLASNEQGWDGPTNMAGAHIAGHALALAHRGVGPYISFAGEVGKPSNVFLADAVRKRKPEGQAFYAEGRRQVGRVEGMQFIPDDLPAPELPAIAAFDNRVKVIPAVPSYRWDLEAEATIRDGYRAVVVELFPTGAGPSGPKDTLTSFIRTVKAKGIVVFATFPNVSEADLTGEHPDPEAEYASTKEIRNAGAVILSKMPTTAAYTKAMWALGQTPAGEQPDPTLVAELVAGKTLQPVAVGAQIQL
jgi:L-asparaginase/Glu-tRNA(Gln) amidotransferase subunit D